MGDQMNGLDNLDGAVALDGDTALIGANSIKNKLLSESAYVVSVLPLAPLGDPCANGSECGSGFCADGVCCATACGDGNGSDCQACSMAAGAMVNGVCATLVAGTVCRAATNACDAPEACNGLSTECAADLDAPDGTACPNGTCNGGTCIEQTGTGGSSGQGGGGMAGSRGSGGAVDTGGNEPGNGESCRCRMADSSATNSFAVICGSMVMGLLAARCRRSKR